MKVISQFVVHVFDLIEAEGRALLSVVREEASRARARASSMAVGVTFLIVSIPLLVAGALLMAAGLMWWLETQVGRPLAAALTGALILGLGGACLLGFRALAGSRQP
ncbi:MAG: hypothetical protein AABZ53_14510 [Planctomycetota bacterium]